MASAPAAFADIELRRDGHVATVEINRPPHNFFDRNLIAQIADAYEQLDADSGCRAIVLASNGKAFCAGANFGSGGADNASTAPSSPSRGSSTPLACCTGKACGCSVPKRRWSAPCRARPSAAASASR